VQVFDQRRQHPVIFHQPVDHGAEPGMSGEDVREQPRVLRSVVTGERAAEAETGQPELLGEFSVRLSDARPGRRHQNLGRQAYSATTLSTNWSTARG
jgi:hypothetical protein